MAEQTKIEWCDHTFNPWEGCQKVAPECDNCYAENRDQRFTGGKHWGPKAPRRRTGISNWHKPLKWNWGHAAFFAAHGRRQRVFCASLADVFDNAVDPQWRADLFDLIRATPNLDWLLLTKRPQNMVKMLPEDWGSGWPHVWLGTSAGTQKTADQNIPHLLATPAAIRFVSAEPLLGPVDLTRWSGLEGDADFGLDWIIVGGESGPKARPMHPDWARSLRDQCQTAGAAYFFKQWGQWLHQSQRVKTPYGIIEADEEFDWSDADERGLIHIWHDQGASIRLRKSHAGRLLDGREHNDTPR